MTPGRELGKRENPNISAQSQEEPRELTRGPVLCHPAVDCTRGKFNVGGVLSFFHLISSQLKNYTLLNYFC